jgi:hypothetical protein
VASDYLLYFIIMSKKGFYLIRLARNQSSCYEQLVSEQIRAHYLIGLKEQNKAEIDNTSVSVHYNDIDNLEWCHH